MDLFVDNYGRSMLEAAKKISTWTYGVTLFPKQLPILKTLTDVFRMGSIEDVFVERDEIESSAKKLLSGVVSGQVKKLVAGTGTGKSTTVPVSLACSISGVGVVITPTRQLAKSLESYVRRSVATGRYSKCQTRLSYEADDLRTATGPAVCYYSASDFLMMLAQDQALFTKVPVGFVYVDEAHERIPQYAVIRYLVSAGIFRDTKLFMGSATSSDQNLESRSGGIRHKSVGIKPENMVYDDFSSLSERSPLHHSRISDRTLVFLPSSEEFQHMAEYYEQNALPVATLPEYATSLEMYVALTFLSESKRPAVLLLTSEHQTGYTFDADTVIDCGVTKTMIVDQERKIVSVVDRPAYEFERIQRCGRVGRHMSGVAYYVDVDIDTPDYEVNPGSECYVALWCRLFSLRLKSPLMRSWADFVEPMSSYKICLLLCATIHPLLLSVFIDDEGDVATGTRVVFLNFLRRQRKLVKSSLVLKPELMTKTWQEQVLVLPCVDYQLREYKSEYLLPSGWALWAHNMYHLLQGINLSGTVKAEGSFVDSGSTIGSAFSNFGSSSSVALSEDYTAAVERTSFDRPRSDASVYKEKVKNKSSVYNPASARIPKSFSKNAKSLPKYDDISDRRVNRVAESLRGSIIGDGDASSTRSVRSTVRGNNNRVGHTAGKHVEDAFDDLLEHDENLTGPSSSARDAKRISKRRGFGRDEHEQTFSEGQGKSAGKSDVQTTKSPFNVSKLWRDMLMPHDLRHVSVFHDMERNKGYYEIFRPFKHNEVLLSRLTRVEIVKYFCVTLVTWNHAVSFLLQIEAMPESNFVAKRMKTMRVRKQEQVLERIKPLLLLFDAYKLFVARLFTYQAGQQLDLTEFAREIEMAECARLMGTPAYQATWVKRDRISTSVCLDGVRVGAALKDGNTVVSACHVFVDPLARPREFRGFPTTELYRSVAKDLVMVRYERGVIRIRSNVSYRKPVVGDVVTVFYPLMSRVVAVGFYNICEVGANHVYEGVLPDGASGAPLVSLFDGCVVGIHQGVYPCYDGQVMSTFIPFQFLSLD